MKKASGVCQESSLIFLSILELVVAVELDKHKSTPVLCDVIAIASVNLAVRDRPVLTWICDYDLGF
jgi:hypothetical protein